MTSETFFHGLGSIAQIALERNQDDLDPGTVRRNLRNPLHRPVSKPQTKANVKDIRTSFNG